MARNYILGTVRIVFFDDAGTIVHEVLVDLPNEGHIAGFSLGHRIELNDAGTTYIATIRDVKHHISIDDSNNYVDSAMIQCIVQ